MFWSEPFFNLDFISQTSNKDHLKIELHSPKFHSMVFKPKNKWDDFSWTTYFNCLPSNSEGTIYMYYRANLNINRTSYHHEHTCMLISRDGGYTFKEPELNIIDFEPNPETFGKRAKKVISPIIIPSPSPSSSPPSSPSPSPSPSPPSEISISKSNNIIWKQDAVTHNFFAFRNQDQKKYNAIGSLVAASCRCCAKGTHLLESNDGINWEKKQIVIDSTTSEKQGYGTFYDSMSTMCWDDYRQEYRVFLRYNHARGVRCIQTSHTKNLESWPKSTLLKYKGPKSGYFYVPVIVSIPNTGYFLGFPSGQSHDVRSTQAIDLMFSRDGVNWDILKHRWLGEQSVSPERFVPQILVAPNNIENLIYINDARATTVNLYTIRLNGLASLVTAIPNQEAWFITNPIKIIKSDLHLNFQLTDPTGYLQVHIYNVNSLDVPIYSDITFSNRVTDSVNHQLNLPVICLNKLIKIKFVLKNCQIFTYGFHLDSNSDTTMNPESYLKLEEYKNIRERKLDPPPPSPSSPNKKKSPPLPKEKVIAEPLDLSHLKILNKQLNRKGRKIIKYKYIDLLKEDIEDVRIYTFENPVIKVTNFEYSNFNERGGGSETYGRTLKFTVTFKDGKTENITLVNNSKSNCKITFVI